MSENTQEKQLPVKEVQLGEMFSPFEDENKIVLHAEGTRIGMDIVLEDIWTHPDIDPYPQKEDVLIPFDPEKGYRITEADLNAQKRAAKIQQLIKSGEKLDPKDLFNLFVGEDDETADISSFGDEDIIDEERRKILARTKIKDPKLLEDLSRRIKALESKLRLQVFFPSGRYESQLTKDIPARFLGFYPMETGSLARGKDISTGEGVDLLLPDDIGKLSKIRMRFVLAPEEPSEGGEK